MSRRTDHDLDRAAWRLSRASVTVPSVLTHIAEQLAHTTSVAASESVHVGGGDISDPTAAAAARRATIIAQRDRILAARRAIGAAIDDLDDACRRALGARIGAAVDAPRCHGGDPSTWGDPECGALVEHYTRADGTQAFRTSGLCTKHRFAKLRWEGEA